MSSRNFDNEAQTFVEVTICDEKSKYTPNQSRQTTLDGILQTTRNGHGFPSDKIFATICKIRKLLK